MEEKVYKIGIDARLWGGTGVGRYIRNLVTELAEQDKTNTYVLFVRKKDEAEVQSFVSQKKNWEMKIADYPWHSFAEQIFFPWQLYKANLSLVHFPYFAVPLLYQKRFVVTIHDLIINHFPTGIASTKSIGYYWIKVLIYKMVMFLSAWRSAKILAVSKATKQEIIDHLHIPNKKVFVTYEGVDSAIHTKEKFGINTNGYFLYVGNVYPHKNTFRLLQAFKEFKNMSITDTKLIFVGKDDFFYQQLRKQIRQLDLESSVKIFTSIEDAELGSLYSHAQAVVVPSLMEGFGLPGLEAMANNCVVIASHIPSLKEVYADAALYIEPTSIESIAEMLKKVYGMGTDEKEIYKKKGKEQVKKFSWKDMAAQTLAVYESSIGV